MNIAGDLVRNEEEQKLFDELVAKREAVFKKYGECRGIDLPPYEKELHEISNWYLKKLSQLRNSHEKK